MLEGASMKNFKRRYIILILVLCVFSVLIFLAKYANQPVKRNIDISKIPLTIGQWQGEDYAVNEEIKDSFKTDSIIMRKYLKADSLIWLDIFYYKDDREVLRLPDSSYIQDGSYIAKSETEEIIDSGWRAFSTNKF